MTKSPEESPVSKVGPGNQVMLVLRGPLTSPPLELTELWNLQLEFSCPWSPPPMSNEY